MRVRAFLTVATAVALAACAGPRRPAAPREVDPRAEPGGGGAVSVAPGGESDRPIVRIEGEDGVVELPATAAGSAIAGAEAADVLKPGDILDVKVFGHPELSAELRVRADGTVAYPFVGRVEAVGRTVDQIALEIANGLQKDMLRDPRVAVSVRTFAERSVYVLGQVGQPSAYAIPAARGLTLVQLISLAGGFLPDADRENVRVVRSPPGGARRTYVVDFVRLEHAASRDSDFPLEDGDTVIVPRLEEVFVFGAVGKAGALVVRPDQPLTLSKAIALSGGFTRFADERDVIVVSGAGRDRRAQRHDVRSIVRGNAPDPALKPGDVVYVTERAF